MGYLGTKPQVATTLADNIVTSDKITDGAVGTSDIADNAITNAKITNATITSAKFASGQTPSFNGITFPGTQVASANANTLDDYEEGTYTPLLLGGVTSPTYDPANTLARYVKIGNFCFVDGRLQISSGTTTSNAVVISLPFTPEGFSPFFPVGTCYFNSVSSNGITARPLATASDNLFFVFQRDNASQQNFTGAMFGANGNVNFTICYRTT